jgi:hypothetical protein
VVLQKLKIEKARFLGEKCLFRSGRVPIFFRFFDAAKNGRVEKRPFLRRFSKNGDLFQRIHTGVFRAFLEIEKRPSRQGHVFPKKMSFFEPSFCRRAFSNDYLVAWAFSASRTSRRERKEQNERFVILFAFVFFVSFVVKSACNKKSERKSRLESTLLRFHWSNRSDFSPPFHESKPIRSGVSNPVIFFKNRHFGSEVVGA